MKNVITISRQYGSGGREIGKKLADKLGIPFYDNELINLAAKESGFCASVFENAENKATNSLLYSIAMGMNAYGNQELGFTNLSLDDRIYLAQSDVIRKVAQKGPCVIVGRCADYVLKDTPGVINVFIWADIDFRIKRVMESDNLTEAKVIERIQKIDKGRANYYNYHSSEKWGRAENYHLSLRSDFIGIDSCADCIKSYIEYANNK
ncbi:cytidylate kinase-like family protein [Anaerocolumna sedimenticola]|uniref:Cytidylate kinase-like family protein n=1 Tax=Anaerocolumna sedimenticola TaxID=2696063 RepID=A0A6P1TM86_9FIRM|nr:cytidylate kinase-like family protein [Anaerocolumna sedimenticola]QHQ60785.1 cytidylate kinase-like family protein [Anaerocolumna sedimenticola]